MISECVRRGEGGWGGKGKRTARAVVVVVHETCNVFFIVRVCVKKTTKKKERLFFIKKPCASYFLVCVCFFFELLWSMYSMCVFASITVFYALLFDVLHASSVFVYDGFMF